MRCKHCQRVIVDKYPHNPDGHVKWAVVRRVPLKLYDKHPEHIKPEWSVNEDEGMRRYDCPELYPDPTDNWDGQYGCHVPEPEIVTYVREVLNG